MERTSWSSSASSEQVSGSTHSGSEWSLSPTSSAPATSGRTYWSDTRSERTGTGMYPAEPGLHHQDLGPLAPDGEVEAHAGGKRHRPRAGGHQHAVGTDPLAVVQLHADGGPALLDEGGHGCVLADTGPAPSGGGGEGQGGPVPVPVPTAGLVGEGRHVVEPGRRPEQAGSVVPDQVDVDPELPVHGHVGLEGPGVGLAHPHQVPGIAVARVLAQDLGERRPAPEASARPWRPRTGCRSGSGPRRWTARCRPRP